MGAQHTPGPWTRGSHDEILVDFPSDGHHFTLVAAGRDCPVALVPGTDRGWRDDPETEANADLIAAAPDLQDALLDVAASLAAAISLLERGPKTAAPSNKMFDQMLTDYRASLTRARAAIAKAQPNQGEG